MPAPLPPNAQCVFRGQLFTIYQWPQTLYDGSTALFECCVRPDTVVIIGFLDKDTVLVTKQEHPHRSEPFWDLAGGRVEHGETAEEAARREFHEETGYNIGTLEQGYVDEHTGAVRFCQTVFFAKDLTLAEGGQHLDAGEKIELVPTSINDLRERCLDDGLRNRFTELVWLRLCDDPAERARLNKFLES